MTVTPQAPAAPTAGPRPTAPRPAVLLALGAGLAAAVVLPAGRPGAGLVLLGAIVPVLVLRLSRARLCGWQRVHAVSALALLAVVVVRDAPWLVAAALLAAGAAASLALTPAHSWPGVVAAAGSVLRTAPGAAPWLGRGLLRAWPGTAVAAPALRGAGLTVLVLAVFVPLLVTADAAFAAALSWLVPPLPELGGLPVRLVVGTAAAVIVAAALQLLVWPRAEPVLAPPGRLARTAEWLLPLLALDLLLAGFLAVQGAALLGGPGHVLRTDGLTYAGYAREGFGQLVVVTALVLAVVGAAVRWAPRGARPLLGVLCALALVVDASALARLDLYADVYGLTRLRVLATLLAGWLGVVLLLVLVAGWRTMSPAGLRPGSWLPHAVAVSGCVCLLVLSAADPDARIAASALDRGDRADTSYLAGLSADAVPVLDLLPEPGRSCALARTAQRASDAAPWTSANLSRSRAADLLERRPVGACAAPSG